MESKFRSVKISASEYDQIEMLCRKTGHKIGFHVARAIRNYMEDEAPVWVQKVSEVERKSRNGKG